MTRQRKPTAKALAAQSQAHLDLGGQEPGVIEDESSDTYVPPRKLRKKSEAQVSTPRTKKKKGPPGNILTLPLDIFTQIALYLMPADILHLARTNKAFRNLLMQCSAAHIWRSASRNIEGLPPCPSHLCEPQYIALIYSKHCTICGATVFRQPDSNLYVRLCAGCRVDALVPMSQVLEGLRTLLPYSLIIVPAADKNLPMDTYCLLNEVTQLQEEYDALSEEILEDEEQMKAWSDEKREFYKERKHHSRQFSGFLLAMEQQRQMEIRGLRQAWRSNAETRLLALGWEAGDLKMTGNWTAWHALIEQPKRLTDRIWKGLYPQMQPLLEENRERRLVREKEARRKARIQKFHSMWASLNHQTAPYLTAGETDENDPFTVAKITKPFPEAITALKWPIIEEIIDMDITPEEMRQKMVKSRAGIQDAVRSWRANFETELAECLRGQSEFETNSLIKTEPMDRIGPPPECDNTMSANARLLLRADSIFKTPQGSSLLFFPQLVPGSFYRQGETAVEDSWSVNQVKRHSRARKVARGLLECLKIPNATYLSVRNLGKRFICGRCHDRDPKNWEEMIDHYLWDQELWTKNQEHIELVQDGGTIFNDMHAFEFETELPLVYLLGRQQAQKFAKDNDADFDEYACCLCDMYGPLSLKQVRVHVRHVHEEPAPELGEHYEDMETHMNRAAEDEDNDDSETELALVFLMCYRMMTMSRYY